MNKTQIIIDVICLIAYAFIAILEKNNGYVVACLWVLIALIAHLDNELKED